jgi:hypothetical protein
MDSRRNILFGSADKVPKTLADFKIWLLYRYPEQRFFLDISQETYTILRDNQIKLEERANDK